MVAPEGAAVTLHRSRVQWPSREAVALIGIAVAVVVVMLAFLGADPAFGVTASNGPFTDESWDVMNARNFVLLGTWATDDWTLHLVNLPFSLSAAAVFSVFGVGIEQARLVSIAATGVTVAALGLGLRRWIGAGPAALAAVAYGGATLVLFYGRLAFLEPMVAMWLTLGALTVLGAQGDSSLRLGILAGVLLALGVGTKPSALAAVVGILAAVAIAGWRERPVRRWVAGAGLSVVVLGLAWAVLIWLPNRSAISDVLRIWASEPIIAPLGTVLHRIATYAASDGFVALSVPLLAAGAVGWGIAAARWRTLGPELRLLLTAACGWLVLGFGLLAVAPYRPNRYEVPLLPALAILVGIGARSASGVITRRAPGRAWVVGVALALVLVVPGMVSYASWMGRATYRLPAVQAQLAAEIPAGSVTQGDYAPAFAMLARAITIVSRPATHISPGDLYASRGVRWFVGHAQDAPVWAELHRAAWDARQQVLCSPWGSEPVCVWRLP